MYEEEYAVTSLCLSALEEEPEVSVRCCVTTEQVVGAWEQCLLTEVFGVLTPKISPQTTQFSLASSNGLLK